MSEEVKLFAVSGICTITRKLEGHFQDEHMGILRVLPLPVTLQMAMPVLALDEDQAIMMGLEHLKEKYPPSSTCYGHEVIAKEVPTQWYSVGVPTGD